jgi:hypothetical protein
MVMPLSSGAVSSYLKPERLGRLGLGEVLAQPGMVGGQQRGRLRDERAERRGEGGQPYAAGPQPHVRGQLLGGGVEAADDLRGPLGEQPARLREPDAAPRALDELGAGLRLQPGEVVADGRLRVVQLLGGGGQRALAGDREEDAETDDIQHSSIVSIDGP